MRVLRLGRSHEPALRSLLEADPTVNLFLLGFLDAHRLDRTWWYGVSHGGLRGAAMILPGRLCVPTPCETEVGFRIGRHLRGLHRPCMMVGPREACDAVWASLGAEVSPRRFYDQRLYVLEAPATRAPPPSAPDGFRCARPEDWRQVAVNSSQMEQEDLGIDPYRTNPSLHEQVVVDRIREGRTWVIDLSGTIVFQINVGTRTPWGCQVGGTYVPPPWRGRGLAVAGMRAIGAALLATHPRVTLHVNEANLPAVRAYERSGFRAAAPFRLITV